MIEVRLTTRSGSGVTVLSQGEWAVVNPLIMKSAASSQAAQAAQAGERSRSSGAPAYDDELGRKPLDN